MKKILATLAALAMLMLTGCENGSEPAEINRFCKSHGGGVLSTDWHGDIIVCADKQAYDLPN